MTMAARVIVTDIGSVLFDFDPDHRFDLLSARTGLPRESLRRRLFDSGFETRCEAGEFTAAEIRDEVAGRIGFDGDLDELSELWTSAFRVNQAVLDTLIETSLPLAIFSNNGPLFADFFDDRFPEAARWFRHRYFACRLKVRKPEAAAYAAVERALQSSFDVEPRDLLFIDDNRENTACAAARGWQVHTFATVEGLRTVLAAAT
jgi:HAD superfamily hydrolase (TIGR01509 family)